MDPCLVSQKFSYSHRSGTVTVVVSAETFMKSGTIRLLEVGVNFGERFRFDIVPDTGPELDADRMRGKRERHVCSRGWTEKFNSR